MRLVLAFHIQLRWAFGNYKKGGVPGVKQMERMWQTYQYDLDEPDNWLRVQRALFWGLKLPQPEIGEGFPARGVCRA